MFLSVYYILDMTLKTFDATLSNSTKHLTFKGNGELLFTIRLQRHQVRSEQRTELVGFFKKLL